MARSLGRWLLSFALCKPWVLSTARSSASSPPAPVLWKLCSQICMSVALIVVSDRALPVQWGLPLNRAHLSLNWCFGGFGDELSEETRSRAVGN
jgi:hypothetical protein